MYGSIIAVGLIVFLVAPFFAKLLRFFPPIVTGTLLTVMGTTLLSVSAGDIVAWADKATDDAAKAAATYEALASPSEQSQSLSSSSGSSRASWGPCPSSSPC